MEVIFANIDLILAAIVVVISAIILARRGQLNMLRELILSLVVGAEIDYGGGTGEIKKAEVTKKVYELLPSLSKLVISENDISNLIESAKSEMDKLASENEAAAKLLYKDDTGKSTTNN